MVGGDHQTPIRQESEGRDLEAIIAVKCDVASLFRESRAIERGGMPNRWVSEHLLPTEMSTG